MFFAGNDPVHQTMQRVVRHLQDTGIAYAVVGGMALNAHGYHRTTGDVDFLLNAEGFDQFRNKLVGVVLDRVPRRPRRFVDRANRVTIGTLVTGRFPGSGDPGPIAFPDPSEVSETIDDIRVVNLATLVELKLAARRWRDFADVVELIRFNDLDVSFTENLHPSVRDDYIECLEEKRREDEYESRQ